jgi:hypothetical protein
MVTSATKPSINSCAKAMSLRCPGDPIRRTGLPSASLAAWILVLKPPRDRPRPWASAPLFFAASAGSLLMRPHDGGIDHQPFQIGLARQGGEDLVQNAHLDPAIVPALHALVFAEPPRQIALAPARAGHPQQRVQKPSIVGAWTSLALPAARHKLLKLLPLVVQKPFAIHRRSPKISVESDSRPLENPP